MKTKGLLIAITLFLIASFILPTFVAGQNLYGMNYSGGTNLTGNLFQFNPATSTYVEKVDFVGANGLYPSGSLLKASDGNLYGMTAYGGANSRGVLFQYNPSTNIYTKKIDFDDTNGANPNGSLIQASDGNLYGMTEAGGAYGQGVLFQYNPATSILIVKVVFDGPNGLDPYGSLIQASDGNLYGMTHDGGAHAAGNLFQYNPVTSTIIDKFDFDYDYTHGDFPYGSLIQASDGNLYGMTSMGGAHDEGVIFQYNSSTSILIAKVDFDYTNGYSPYSSLIQATDGNLYGMTEIGGTKEGGILFQYNPATSTLIAKVDFDYTNEDENLPQGSLMQASDGNLYGMTGGGGANDYGVIFQFNPATSICTKKLDFTQVTGGAFNNNSLIEVPCSTTTSTTNATACNSYVWNGSTYTASGSYTYHTTNAMGCDSTATLNLTLSCNPIEYAIAVNGSVAVNIQHPFGTFFPGDAIRPIEVCNGVNLSIFWNTNLLLVTDPNNVDVSNIPGKTHMSGNAFTIFGPAPTLVSGNYHFTINTGEIDPGYPPTYVVTIYITILPTASITGTPAICSGNPATLDAGPGLRYLWSTGAATRSITVSTAGIYSVTMADSFSCPNVTGSITVYTGNNTSSTTNQTACNNYVWNGSTYTVSGSYIYHTTNAAGCDSAAILNLTIIHSSTSNTNQTANYSYTWNGTTYTVSGTYVYHTTNAAGCDSAASLNLIVNHPIAYFIAENGSYQVTINNPLFFTYPGQMTQPITICSDQNFQIFWNTNLLKVTDPNNVDISNIPGQSQRTGPNQFEIYGIGRNPISGNYNFTINTAQLDSSYPATSVVTIYITFGPTPSISGALAICPGSATVLNAGSYKNYRWSTNEATQTIHVSTAGNYSVTVTDSIGCQGTASATVTINNCGAALALNLKMFIQGYYQNVGTATQMDNSGNGGCLFLSGVSVDPAEVDTVTISLMDPNTKSQVGSSIQGVLHTDGSVWQNGTRGIILPGSALGKSYYIRVTHHSALETWSANTILLDSTNTYDFSTSLNKAYGDGVTNMVWVDNIAGQDVYAFWSGDVVNEMNILDYGQDGVVDGGDYSLEQTDFTHFLFGYYTTDITGDGVVDGSDYGLLQTNFKLFIFKQTPW